MKVLLAPVNIAGQPIQIVNELKRMGVDATLLQYAGSDDGKKAHAFGYQTDKIVNIALDRRQAMFATVKKCLDEGYDLYHFWLRTFCYGRAYNDFLGLDLPFIKARNKRVVYRFTGYDLRLKSEDLRKNPYSAFRYGYDLGFDEEMQKKYLAFLEEYVDEFIVQDPEMHSFFPKAKVVPRMMDLSQWEYCGIGQTDKPLVVHAPSIKKSKGTAFVKKAISDLKDDGLEFDYQPITGMKHEDAARWYQKADIVIDQLHAGWYGVLTMEAMALGKPVIVYIREALLDGYEHDIPIRNANPDTIKESLKTLIRDYDLRKELGDKGRQYVEKVHDIKKVVPRLLTIYNTVLETEPVQPTSYADIDYYEAQVELLYKGRLLSPQEVKSGLIRFRWQGHKIRRLRNKLRYWLRRLIQKIVLFIKCLPVIKTVYNTPTVERIRAGIKSAYSRLLKN